MSTISDNRNLAATIKSNYSQLEGGRGLRIGIVPESAHVGNSAGIKYDSKTGLWIASLADPNGFMGMFNDGYHAVMRAMVSIGKQSAPPYWIKPSAKAQRLMQQLIKFEGAKVLEIEDALNEAAQQNLVGVNTRLVSVNAPDWLHLKQLAPKIISPKPSFVKL